MGRRFEPVWAHVSLTPRVSIIIPVFNGSNFLRQTIDSILSNTNSALCELIVIDDGSKDETSQICASFGAKIRYEYQINQGEFAATNRGFDIAEGDFIMIVSHDDPMLSPNLIPRAIEILDQHLELACVYPDWQIINSEGEVIAKKIVQEYSEDELIGRFNCLPGPGAVFRKKLARDIGGRRNWKYGSDYDFWLRLSRLGEFKRIPGVYAQWRSHGKSTTVSMKGFDMASERIAIMKNFVTENTINPKLARVALSSAYYYAARLGVFSKKIPAKKWLIISFLKRRNWPEVANPLVVLFTLTLPLSSFLLNLLVPYSKKLQRISHSLTN